ncbi:zf-HC2 domain-containing protein [Promicromonospora sp. NPDC050880]|uniref:zf-HC2 domain-containing protein n=1 Tax=Promicromonospora sp. NPDC050880 TaxID=3364406 RepID=UPI0037ACBC3F
MTITSSSWIGGPHPDPARLAAVAALRAALSTLADGRRDDPAGPGPVRTRSVPPPACRTTRAAMYDYVKGSLVPSRQRRVEAHLDGCGRCTRAFADVREESWALRGLGRRLAAHDHQGGRHRRTAHGRF